VSSIVTRFRVDRISEEVARHRFRADAAWLQSLDLGSEARFALPVVIDVEIVRSGEESTEGPAGRARTRREPGLAREAGSRMVDSESEEVFHHVNGWLDLNPLLREQIVLCIPNRALCSEDCRGLCPSCGADLNAKACACAESEGFTKFEKLRALRIR
jgi:hypothetical protein